MKKYYVILTVNSQEFGYSIIARDEKSAKNKAIKRAQFSTKDKTITLDNVKSVDYEGFYLARRFFPAQYVWIKKS